MIVSKIFEDIIECRKQIEIDYHLDLDQNIESPSVFLRGEHCWYDTSESSMKRLLTASDGKTMKGFHYVQPFIDFEDIYSEFHSDKHGLSYEEGVGFLQHYGFPTDLLDITPSFDTARFFACYGKESKPEGVIGVFGADQIGGHFKITDLSKDPVAQRPRNQHAYVARPNPGLHDLKGALCDELCKPNWYRFKKSQGDFDFVQNRKELIYPTREETAYFFGHDLWAFFTTQPAYDEMTLEQIELIKQFLAKTIQSLGGPN